MSDSPIILLHGVRIFQRENLILNNVDGRLVVLKNGRYDNVPISVVTSKKKVVDVRKYYNTERLRPFYHSFEMQPMLIMTSEG